MHEWDGNRVNVKGPVERGGLEHTHLGRAEGMEDTTGRAMCLEDPPGRAWKELGSGEWD